jgi:hypothetical protein
MKIKKYERPINSLASWADTSCSDDDESGDVSICIPDDVEYSYRCGDEDDDCLKKAPKHDLSSLHRVDRGLEEPHQKDRQIQTKICCCWNRKARPRKWCILCAFALAILLLGLISVAIYLGLFRARRSNNNSHNDVVENEQDESESVTSGAYSLSQEETVVLRPNEYLAAGQFRSSPNDKYRLELTEAGDFVLTHNGEADRTTIWSTSTTDNDVRVYLQPDGNVLLRNVQRKTLWSSETHGYPGARLLLSDAGVLSIQNEGLTESAVSTTIWMDGVPRNIYRGPAPTNEDLVFPVRGAFYYP